MNVKKQICELILNNLFSEDTNKFFDNCEFSSYRMAFAQGMNYVALLCTAKLTLESPQYEELVTTLRKQCDEMDCGNCNTCVKRQAADAIEELTNRIDEPPQEE